MRSTSHTVTQRQRATASSLILGIVAIALGTLAPESALAEKVRVGVTRNTVAGPVFIAQETGYFAAEGFTSELVFFDAAQQVAVAVVSGDIEFGLAGLTGGLFSLAGQGALRIVGAGNREAPSFPYNAFVASNRAYAAGLKSYRDLPGHRVAFTTLGSPVHYAFGLIAEKYHFDLASLRLLPLQTVPNMISAVSGGQGDAAVIPGTAGMPAIERGDIKLISWVGDDVQWQFNVVLTATKTANEAQETVKRFLRAYLKGMRDYHDAFTGTDEERRDGPTAPATLAIIAKYIGQPPEQIARSIAYMDGGGRLDVKDVLHQIEWYKSQGMVKPELRGEEIIDPQYVIALP